MHLAEGILPIGQAVTFSAAAGVILAWSIRGEKQLEQDGKLPSVLMAGVTSLLFAVTLLPLPVPIIGATSHICLTPVLALIVSIRRIVWPTFFVLLLQALFFAHGGLTTLGINTITLGLVGPLSTISIWIVISRLVPGNAIGLALACGVGGLVVYVADALVLALALADVADPMVTFTNVILGFSPVQIPLAFLESAVSVAIIRLLAIRRPDLLPASLRMSIKPKQPWAKIAIIITVFGLAGCSYQGIDGTVFGATAEAVGRTPTDSIMDLSQGEVGLAMSILILFGLGFISGRSWDRIFNRENDARSR